MDATTQPCQLMASNALISCRVALSWFGGAEPRADGRCPGIGRTKGRKRPAIAGPSRRTVSPTGKTREFRPWPIELPLAVCRNRERAHLAPGGGNAAPSRARRYVATALARFRSPLPSWSEDRGTGLLRRRGAPNSGRTSPRHVLRYSLWQTAVAMTTLQEQGRYILLRRSSWSFSNNVAYIARQLPALLCIRCIYVILHPSLRMHRKKPTTYVTREMSSSELVF